MATHTAGPWAASKLVAQYAACEITSPDGRKVATVWQYNNGEMVLPEAEANATVIAAAPSLLGALEDAEATLTAYINREFNSPELDVDLVSCLENVRHTLRSIHG